MSKLEALSKIAALAYLLWLYLRLRERKVPPCETCKHLDKKEVEFRGDNKPWRCEYGGYKGTSLKYCSRYSPRDEEGGEWDE